jgi:hypothetical protein
VIGCLKFLLNWSKHGLEEKVILVTGVNRFFWEKIVEIMLKEYHPAKNHCTAAMN